MDNPKDNPEYFKILDAARFLGVNPRTIYRRVWSGELPAAKIGGLYFIRRADLEQMLNPSAARTLEPVQPAHGVPDFGVMKCGYCYRLITSDSQIGEVCAHEACAEVVCASCLADGIRYCAAHLPTRDQLWEQAAAKHERGELPVLVKASVARLREINFLNRIKSRLFNISTLVHPQSGEAVTIKNWSDCLEDGDERLELMRLMGKVVLDGDSLARLPLNAWFECRPPLPKNAHGGPLGIQVRTLSRLDEMLRSGFDARPLTVDDLAPWLARLSALADQEGITLLATLASVTGWDASARQAVQGVQSTKGGPTPAGGFAHRLLQVYLFDLESAELVYNPFDDRSRKYAELFVPLLPSEEVEEAVKAVEKELGMFDSLTLQSAAQVLPYSERIIKMAFERLVSTGHFTLLEMPELGTALVRQ
jgi:excisionase family DNA binding protein